MLKTIPLLADHIQSLYRAVAYVTPCGCCPCRLARTYQAETIADFVDHVTECIALTIMRDREVPGSIAWTEWDTELLAAERSAVRSNPAAAAEFEFIRDVLPVGSARHSDIASASLNRTVHPGDIFENVKPVVSGIASESGRAFR